MVASMPAVPSARINVPTVARLPGRRERIPPAVEITGWLVLLACAVGLRWWVAAGLPTYLWTRDSGSYLSTATAWLNGGPWVTSPRRGPVYSLFMAWTLRWGGGLKIVADVQAAVGLVTTTLTLGFARAWLGRRAFWPLLVCAVFYVFYGLPIELERLIRNETLLALFATVAFGAWFCALRAGSAGWLALSGVSTGLLQLLKGIFPVFPVIVLGIIVWNWRAKPRRVALLAGVYLASFLLPLVGSSLYTLASGTGLPPEPEDGEMFFGRTAQWTYLGADGILPDLKARIHDQAAAYADRYRRTGKLDNNEIVKRTVVPTLKTIIVDERGGTLADVNRTSWRLGLEAVFHHPGEYGRQLMHDLYYLNFITAQRMVPFEPRQLQGSARDAELYANGRGQMNALTTRLFDAQNSRAATEKAAQPGSGLQRCARFITGVGRVRFLSPVFLTSLLLPLLTYLTRGRSRLFWLGNLILWYYYLVLLSTVGRPLDRYMQPVVPIMFWTVSTAAAVAWQRWSKRPPVATT